MTLSRRALVTDADTNQELKSTLAASINRGIHLMLRRRRYLGRELTPISLDGLDSDCFLFRSSVKSNAIRAAVHSQVCPLCSPPPVCLFSNRDPLYVA